MVTGDPAWKEFERMSAEIDRQNSDRLDVSFFRHFVLPVMTFLQEADCFSEVMWRVNFKASRITFALVCNDTFAPASADAEPLETQTDLSRLYSAMRDLQRVEKENPGSVAVAYLPELYAARRRKQRPMRRWLEQVCGHPAVRELFLEIPEFKPEETRSEEDVRESDVPEVLPAASPGEAEELPRPGLGEAMPGSAL
jgi:hypothetical protein